MVLSSAKHCVHLPRVTFVAFAWYTHWNLTNIEKSNNSKLKTPTDKQILKAIRIYIIRIAELLVKLFFANSKLIQLNPLWAELTMLCAEYSQADNNTTFQSMKFRTNFCVSYSSLGRWMCAMDTSHLVYLLSVRWTYTSCCEFQYAIYLMAFTAWSF